EPRVDEDVAQIDEEIDEDDGEDEQHHHRLDDDQVALGDALEDQAAEAGEEEDVLDDDAAGEQERELQADDGQHRDQRVAHGVAPERGAAGKAVGAGGADVVLLERIEERGAHDAREDRGLRQGQRDGGQGKGAQAEPEALVPAGKAAGGEPAQAHRKNEDEQHREPEVRHGDAELGDAGDDQVGLRIAAGGGEDAGGEGDEHGQKEREQRQRQRDAVALQYDGAHRRAVAIADAEIAMQHAEHPGDVAGPGGGIQAELLAQRGKRIGAGIEAKHELRRIAGHHLEHEEDDDARNDQAEDQRGKAAEEVGRHSASH